MPFFTCCKLRKRKRISKLEDLNSNENELEQFSINNSTNSTRNALHLENEKEMVPTPNHSELKMSCSTNGHIAPVDFHRRKISFVLPPLWHNGEFYYSKKEIECTNRNSSLNQIDSSSTATKSKPNVEVTTKTSLIPPGHLPQIDFQRHLRSALQPLFNNEAFYNSKTEIGCTNNSQNGNSTERKANPVEVATQTSPIPSSRIPVPINIPARPSTMLSRRTPSPTKDIAVQVTSNNGNREGYSYKPSKNALKLDMHLPPLPPLSGKDYISPIDLGSRRNWPLIFSSMSSLEGE